MAFFVRGISGAQYRRRAVRQGSICSKRSVTDRRGAWLELGVAVNAGVAYVATLGAQWSTSLLSVIRSTSRRGCNNTPPVGSCSSHVEWPTSSWRKHRARAEPARAQAADRRLRPRHGRHPTELRRVQVRLCPKIRRRARAGERPRERQIRVDLDAQKFAGSVHRADHDGRQMRDELVGRHPARAVLLDSQPPVGRRGVRPERRYAASSSAAASSSMSRSSLLNMSAIASVIPRPSLSDASPTRLLGEAAWIRKRRTLGCSSTRRRTARRCGG